MRDHLAVPHRPQVTLSERYQWSEGEKSALPVHSMSPSPSHKRLFVSTVAGTLHTLVLDYELDASAPAPDHLELDKVCVLV